jgi:hypothetical protein
MRVVVASSVATPQNARQPPHIGIERADKIGCRNHTLQLGHKLKCLMIATLLFLSLGLFVLAMACLVVLRQGVQIAANRYLVGKNLANLHDGSIVIGSHKTMFKDYIGGYLLELVNVRSSIVFWGFSIRDPVASSNMEGGGRLIWVPIEWHAIGTLQVGDTQLSGWIELKMRTHYVNHLVVQKGLMCLIGLIVGALYSFPIAVHVFNYHGSIFIAFPFLHFAVFSPQSIFFIKKFLLLLSRVLAWLTR